MRRWKPDDEKMTNITSRSGNRRASLLRAAGSDTSHTRISLEDFAPVGVSDKTYGSGLRCISCKTNRTTNKSTTYAHNPFGDLTGIDYSDTTPDIAITPDRLGRPAQIADASGTRDLEYEPVTGGLDLVSYASGPLASLEVDYTWDTSHRPAGYAVTGNGPVSVLG
jgi:hypothetical protein